MMVSLQFTLKVLVEITHNAHSILQFKKNIKATYVTLVEKSILVLRGLKIIHNSLRAI